MLGGGFFVVVLFYMESAEEVSNVDNNVALAHCVIQGVETPCY